MGQRFHCGTGGDGGPGSTRRDRFAADTTTLDRPRVSPADAPPTQARSTIPVRSEVQDGPAVDGLAGMPSVVDDEGAPHERPGAGQVPRHSHTETPEGGTAWLRDAVEPAPGDG